MSSSPADARSLSEQFIELATLAGGLAHEIKNPLSTIQMNLQLLAEDAPAGDSPEAKRFRKRIETTREECRRLADILDDFLRFAHSSRLSAETVSLNDVVRELIDFSQPRIESAGIVLRADLAESLPLVKIDRELFRQSLLNLLLNAESFLKPGDELILRSRKDGGWVVLDVIDTGPGIPKDMHEKIFTPFYSTRKGGTGLGLPTTRRILEAHGGKLTLDSEPGKGSAFHLFLPSALE